MKENNKIETQDIRARKEEEREGKGRKGKGTGGNKGRNEDTSYKALPIQLVSKALPLPKYTKREEWGGEGEGE